jgi:colanic acid/amylovoran biosynthesis glycosyltransferase
MTVPGPDEFYDVSGYFLPQEGRGLPLLRAAGIFALASFAEGIPVVLMESVSMEIPCIAACINGIPELIRDSSEGLLVPPSESGALAAAIARLRDDAALRESWAKPAGPHSKAYNLHSSADHLAGVFRRRQGKD